MLDVCHLKLTCDRYLPKFPYLLSLLCYQFPIFNINSSTGKRSDPQLAKQDRAFARRSSSVRQRSWQARRELPELRFSQRAIGANKGDSVHPRQRVYACAVSRGGTSAACNAYQDRHCLAPGYSFFCLNTSLPAILSNAARAAEEPAMISLSSPPRYTRPKLPIEVTLRILINAAFSASLAAKDA